MQVSRDILPSSDAAQLIDFTCATPWERLALDIELAIRSWNLHDGNLPQNAIISASSSNSSSAPPNTSLDPPPITCAQVAIGDKALFLELRNNDKKHLWEAYPLERMLGLSKCIILTADTQDGIAADDGSDAAVLLSALSVAASACSCTLPVIVPVGRPSSLRFIGRQVYPTQMRFSCDYTYQMSEEYDNLAGLLKLFQNKRTASKRLSPPSVHDAYISAKFIYDWIDFSFKIAPTPGSFASERRLNAIQTIALSESDPVRRIRVTAIWDEFAASSLRRNKVLAGMPASSASRLRLSPSADLLETISSSRIPTIRIPLTTPALSILRHSQTASNLRHSRNPAAPLQVLTIRKRRSGMRLQDNYSIGTGASRTHMREGGTSPRVGQPPAPSALNDYLVQVGEYVAAAAVQDDTIDEQFLTSAVAALFEMDLGRGIMADVVDALGPNAAETTVLERLARLIGASETVNGAQKLWSLFLDGIELHWEQQWIVSGVPFSASSGPDHDASLLVQKLQMINCCVERQRREVIGVPAQKDGDPSSSRGRKSILEGMELIGGRSDTSKSSPQKGTIVWEPHVQPHPLATRDMVEEELQRMVLRAESNEKSGELEAKGQSLTLKSDMMAFKAANPTASLADFIRWFSPSDWVARDDSSSNILEGVELPVDEAEEPLKTETSVLPMKLGAQGEDASSSKPVSENLRRRGRLSARMSRKGNVWEELWEGAEELAASQQEPLFDASANGSKALGDLRAMPMTQVLLHLAAIQGGYAISLLQHAFSRNPQLPNVRARVNMARQAIREVCAILKLDQADVTEMGRVAAAVDTVATAEHTGLIATSIFTKLPPVDGLGHVVDSLACGAFADVEQERERELIARMAGLDDGGWRSVLLPDYREFVIRGSTDGEEETDSSDRMYTRMSREEFRVAFRLGLDYSV